MVTTLYKQTPKTYQLGFVMTDEDDTFFLCVIDTTSKEPVRGLSFSTRNITRMTKILSTAPAQFSSVQDALDWVDQEL